MFWRNFRSHYSKRPRLHTEGVEVVFPETVREHMNLQCNSDQVLYTNMPEVRHLSTMLANERPKRVLEIGGGIGRASVYLSKRFSWDETEFYMLDGDSGSAQIAPIDGQTSDAFYNSHRATIDFCQANKIESERVHLLNAESDDWSDSLKGVKLDLIYSFLAIGFHWPIQVYLDRLRPFCHDKTRLIFGMRGTDRGSKFAKKQLNDIDKNAYRVELNARDSESLRSSVLVLRSAA